jgi:hypothetical protein
LFVIITIHVGEIGKEQTGWMPPNIFQFPKRLTEAEVIEAEEELLAMLKPCAGRGIEDLGRG